MPSSDETIDFSTRAEQKWSKAANSYVRYFEPMTIVAGRFLLSLIKLRFQCPQQHTANNNIDSDDDGDSNSDQHQTNSNTVGLRILEAGCGAGGLAKEILLDASSPSSSLSISELVLTDLSEGMLERAKGALNDIATDNSNIIRVEFDRADFTGFDKDKYPDGYFDRYYSNLCLHYAEDPDTVISEAARVLKPGGIAGFTVWGRKADSPVMTIVPEILSRFQKIRSNREHEHDPSSVAPPSAPKRSSFHMGEDDIALRQRFFGGDLFSKCTVVHYPAVLESLDPDDYVQAILDGAPSTKKELEDDYSPSDRQQIRRMVREKAAEILAGGEPLVLDMAMVVAQK